MTVPTIIGHVDAYMTGTGTRTVTPHASTQVGDLMILVIAANDQTVTPLSGWTVVKAEPDTGTLRTAVFAKFREEGETTYSFSMTAVTTTQSVITVRGVEPDISHLIVGADGMRAVNGTSFTNVAPAITTTSADTLVLTISTERTSTTETGISSISTGAADYFVPQNGGVGLETIHVSHVNMASRGASSPVTITYPKGEASNGYAFQLGLQSTPTTDFTGSAAFSLTGSLVATGTPSATGSAAFTGTGTLAPTGIMGGSNLVAFSGAGSLAASGKPGLAGAAAFTGAGTLSTAANPGANGVASFSGAGTVGVTTSTPVELFMAQTMYAAHRGGSADWPEGTLFAYRQAAAWNANLALEISMFYTTDGVAVSSHDQTTGRVFNGPSLDITTSTWAALSSKTTIVGGQPIAKVTDILDELATGNRVIFIDNKGQQNQTAFYNMLASYGGTARFIIKAFAGSVSWSGTASSRGYKSWGYFFDADVANHATWAPLWTMLGLNYDGTTGNWATIKSYNKPILAHILPSAASKVQADSRGVQGYMAAGVQEVVPQTPAQVTFTGTGTVTASGTLQHQGAATFTAAGTLTSSATPSLRESVTFTGQGTLLAVGQPAFATAVLLDGDAGLAVIGTPGVKGVAVFDPNAALQAAGVPALKATVPFSGAGTLNVAGVQQHGNTAVFQGHGVMTVVGRQGASMKVPRVRVVIATTPLHTLEGVDS